MHLGSRRPNIKAVLLLLLLISSLAPVRAQSPFDGVWKIDMSKSQVPTKGNDYLLQDNRYRCSTCDPPLDVMADGRDQKITGASCYDSVSLKVVNDLTTVETDKRQGKTVSTTKMTVSADGNSATIDWMEMCNAKGDVVSGKLMLIRVTPGPRGSHAVSGSWQIVKRSNVSENALVITLKLDGDTFSFADPTGQSFSARLDGTETPYKGSLSHTTASVKRLGENTIEVTNKTDGKVVEVWRFTPSVDGNSMAISREIRSSGSTQEILAHKQ